MGEISINPKFNIHETYKKVRILNPYRNSGAGSTYLSSLFADYKFNDNLVDEVNGYNGIGSNLTYTTGLSGNAANFNGSSSFIDIADADDFSYTDGTNDTPFSIGMRVKFNSTTDQWVINRRDTTTNLSEYDIAYFLGLFRFRILDRFGNYIMVTIPKSIIIGQWYNLIFTYDGSKTTSGMKIYIDSINQNVSPVTSGVFQGISNTNSKTVIGKAGWFDGFYFNGAIDNLRMFNKGLTQEEVTTEYNL